MTVVIWINLVRASWTGRRQETPEHLVPLKPSSATDLIVSEVKYSGKVKQVSRSECVFEGALIICTEVPGRLVWRDKKKEQR